MNSPSTEPDRYALMGHPIAHSWSPFIHGMLAKQTGQNLNYRLLDVTEEKFRSVALEFFAGGGRGLNVTVPHKRAAAEMVNRMTPRAERAHAVNTILFDENQELLGDNTDGTGLIADLKTNLGLSLGGMRVLLLGAGGATRGVLAPLLESGPGSVVIANRTVSRAVELAEEFSDLSPITGCGFDELVEKPFDLIVNATSASLQGEMPPLPDGVVNAKTFCYDMAYGKGETSFTRWAKRQGAGHAVKGWGMLVEQAAESFQLWRGIRPETKPVLEVLKAL